MRSIKLVALSLITATSINALTLSAIGQGNTESESTKDALSTLSSQLSVEVKSDFKSYTTVLAGKYAKNKEKFVEVSSSLPIKGVVLSNKSNHNSIETTAILSTKNALNAYLVELDRLSKNIKDSKRKLKQTNNNNLKYSVLNQLLNDIENFNKHKIVATLLEGKDLPTLNITIATVKQQLKTIEEKVPSIEIASDILTKDMTQKDIYIFAPKVSGSMQVTQFAKILKDTMSKTLKIVKKPNSAQYFLRGNYEILDNSIFVTINISNRENEILKTTTVTLDKQAYKNIKYKATTQTFDSSNMINTIKSGKLSVEIGFKGYNRANGIDLNEGDKVDFIVKTNKNMCYYLVGYILENDKDEKFSYLIPINNQFTNNITGSDLNIAIPIYEGAIMEDPFGSETLQIVSSTLNQDKSCPLKVPHCVEDDRGYCVIGGKPIDTLFKTKGFPMRSSANSRVRIEKAESSISYTSFER